MDQRPLRIGLAGGGNAELPFTDSALHAGTAPGSAVALGPGAARRHLELTRIRDGVVLRVCEGAPHVYVNARPVRRCALLRVGDAISVGTDALVLLGPEAPQDATASLPEIRPRASGSASLIGLRVVAGPLSGQRFAIDAGDNLDSLRLPGVEGCLRLRPLGARVAFDYIASEARVAAPDINGVAVRRGSLAHGDQIAWGKHRLILEMPASAIEATPAPPSPDAQASSVLPAGDSGTGVWWLIATAVVLALVITGLLLARS